MAFTVKADDISDLNNIKLTVVHSNITRSIVVGRGDLDGPPMASVEYDEFLKICARAAWYGANGTPAQKLGALQAGVNLATATLKLRNYLDGSDVST